MLTKILTRQEKLRLSLRELVNQLEASLALLSLAINGKPRAFTTYGVRTVNKWSLLRL